jgi:hypothetical protein
MDYTITINNKYLEHFTIYFDMILTNFFNHFHASKINNSSILIQNIDSVIPFKKFIQRFPINYQLLYSFYKQLYQQISFLEDNNFTFILLQPHDFIVINHTFLLITNLQYMTPISNNSIYVQDIILKNTPLISNDIIQQTVLPFTIHKNNIYQNIYNFFYSLIHKYNLNIQDTPLFYNLVRLNAFDANNRFFLLI